MDRHRGERQAPRPRPRHRDHREAPRGGALSEAKSRGAADVPSRSEGGVGLSEAKSRGAADVPSRSEGGVGLSEAKSRGAADEAEEELPFDAHVERFPKWGIALSALTIVVAICTALDLVTSLALVIPLIASTTARRFGVSPIDASIDREGLWLGDTLVAPRGDIVDVWAAPDQTDHRVSVAVKPDELIVLLLPNAEQARRFAHELAPRKSEDPERSTVAGHRARALDALYPLRLFFVIASFVANSGWRNPAALLLFVFFAIGAYGFVVATQIEAGPAGLTLRRVGRERHIPWPEVTEEMLDAIPARVVRSPLLTTSSWTKQAHARVIAHAKEKLPSKPAPAPK